MINFGEISISLWVNFQSRSIWITLGSIFLGCSVWLERYSGSENGSSLQFKHFYRTMFINIDNFNLSILTYCNRSPPLIYIYNIISMVGWNPFMGQFLLSYPKRHLYHFHKLAKEERTKKRRKVVHVIHPLNLALHFYPFLNYLLDCIKQSLKDDFYVCFYTSEYVLIFYSIRVGWFSCHVEE